MQTADIAEADALTAEEVAALIADAPACTPEAFCPTDTKKEAQTMKQPLDRDALDERVEEQAQALALDCQDDLADDRLTPPDARENALTALRSACLGLDLHGMLLHGMLLPGIAAGRRAVPRRDGRDDNQRAGNERDETVSEWLLHVEGLRDELTEALPDALEYVAGRTGRGGTGMDTEDAIATAISRLLALGNLCIEAAAWLIRLRLTYLKVTPRNRP